MNIKDCTLILCLVATLAIIPSHSFGAPASSSLNEVIEEFQAYHTAQIDSRLYYNSGYRLMVLHKECDEAQKKLERALELAVQFDLVTVELIEGHLAELMQMRDAQRCAK